MSTLFFFASLSLSLYDRVALVRVVHEQPFSPSFNSAGSLAHASGGNSEFPRRGRKRAAYPWIPTPLTGHARANAQRRVKIVLDGPLSIVFLVAASPKLQRGGPRSSPFFSSRHRRERKIEEEEEEEEIGVEEGKRWTRATTLSLYLSTESDRCPSIFRPQFIFRINTVRGCRRKGTMYRDRDPDFRSRQPVVNWKEFRRRKSCKATIPSKIRRSSAT